MTASAERTDRSLPALGSVLVALLLAACSAGSGVTPPSLASAAPGETAVPPPATPATSDAPDGGLGQGGSDALVVPKPGQLEVHPIPADSFAASVDGRRVVVIVTYTSGVEPCSILDTIIVQRGEGSFAITLREGHGPGNQVCIMIARVMRTGVDLGKLDPGTYTITDATGGAGPIRVVVS